MKSTDGIYLGKLTVQISMKKKMKKKKKQGPTLFTKRPKASVMDVRTEPLFSPRPPLVQQIVDLEESSANHLSKFARYQEVQSGVRVPSVTETKVVAGSRKIKPVFAMGENGKKMIGELVERAERLHHEMVQSVMEDEFRPRTRERNVHVR